MHKYDYQHGCSEGFLDAIASAHLSSYLVEEGIVIPNRVLASLLRFFSLTGFENHTSAGRMEEKQTLRDQPILEYIETCLIHGKLNALQILIGNPDGHHRVRSGLQVSGFNALYRSPQIESIFFTGDNAWRIEAAGGSCVRIGTTDETHMACLDSCEVDLGYESKAKKKEILGRVFAELLYETNLDGTNFVTKCVQAFGTVRAQMLLEEEN